MKLGLNSRKANLFLLVAVLLNTVLSIMFVASIDGKSDVVYRCSSEIEITQVRSSTIILEYDGYAMWTQGSQNKEGMAFFGGEKNAAAGTYYTLKENTFEGFIDELCYGQEDLLEEHVFEYPTTKHSILFVLGAIVFTYFLVSLLLRLIIKLQPRWKGMLLIVVGLLLPVFTMPYYLFSDCAGGEELFGGGGGCLPILIIKWEVLIPILLGSVWMIWIGRKHRGSLLVIMLVIGVLFLELLIPSSFEDSIRKNMYRQYQDVTGSAYQPHLW